MTFLRLRTLGGLAGLVTALAGCARPAATAPPSAAAAPAPVVTLVKPERKSLAHVIARDAHVEAFEETPLFARITGHVQKVYVDLGDRVRGPRFDAQGKQVEAGQVLAELYVPEMEEELRQKQALVAQARAEEEQAGAALEAAEANVATAQALVLEAEAGRERVGANYQRWESEYERMEKLTRSKVIDQQARDEALNQLKAAGAARKEVEAKVGSARAGARESEAKRNRARADVTAAKARIRVTEAEAGRTKALLEYSKVRAPYDGVITARNVHTGHYLAGAGTTPLFVIARMDTVRILVEVPEADAAYVAKGVPARVRLQMLKGQEFRGEVARSSWSLDAKARTLRTEIDLPNPEGRLRPGMYAYVTFEAALPGEFTLPASAVVLQGDAAHCFQVEGGKAVRTPVRVGARNAQFVQVLKKQAKSPGASAEQAVWVDFTGQEQVVVNPASLADGQPVTVGGKS
jgi:multidrug efflux pump subunit AcrA (membrane-fusion protein)